MVLGVPRGPTYIQGPWINSGGVMRPVNTALLFDLRMTNATTAVRLVSTDGITAAVSAAGEGAIRYNDTDKTWEGSEDGSAFAAFAGIGTNPFTKTLTVIHQVVLTDPLVLGDTVLSAVGDELLRVDGITRLNGDLRFETGATRNILVDTQTGASAAGNILQVQAGEGGATVNPAPGGTGGQGRFFGGIGGDGEAVGSGGLGGVALLQGGSGGFDNGGGPGPGGATIVNGGAGVDVDGVVFIGQATTLRIDIANVADAPPTTFLGLGLVTIDGPVTANLGIDVSGGVLEAAASIRNDGSVVSLTFYEATDGLGSAVSAAGEMRLIYNDTTKTAQLSLDGAAYADVGMGATVDLFLPLGDYNGSDGDYRVRDVSGAGSHEFNFTVPLDFVSLISIGLVAYPDATAGGAGKDIDMTSSYGNLDLGQVKDFHTESDLASTFTIPALDVLFELDVSGVFSSPGLQAGDAAGVKVDHNGLGGTIRYIGFRLQYNTV